MEVVFMIVMFLLFVGITLNDVQGSQRWSRLLDMKGVTMLIVFWSICGFLLRIHFSSFTMLYSGPEAVLEPLWGFKNIGMALVPILLYWGALSAWTQKRARLIICLELGFWLFIYFFAKGSYGWGYHFQGYYMIYDYIALVLRFLLVMYYLGIKSNRFSAAWLLAHVAISCKVNMFGGGCFG